MFCWRALPALIAHKRDYFCKTGNLLNDETKFEEINLKNVFWAWISIKKNVFQYF